MSDTVRDVLIRAFRDERIFQQENPAKYSPVFSDRADRMLAFLDSEGRAIVHKQAAAPPSVPAATLRALVDRWQASEAELNAASETYRRNDTYVGIASGQAAVFRRCAADLLRILEGRG